VTKPDAKAAKNVKDKIRTHVDLEEMRSHAINCHPHPNGIGRELQKSSRIAQVERDQRLEERETCCTHSLFASPPETATAFSSD
jgi:hypothetical protein